MPADPIVKPLGDSLWIIWPARATFEFSRVHEHADTLSAEVAVVSTTAGELSWARLNLASTQSRSGLVRVLEEREPTEDWRGLVERSCRLVAQHIRVGDPAKILLPEAPTEVRWAVPGWMPAQDISVLYGDGGAGKSFVALALALSGLLDRPITPTWRMQPLTRVLYLDWEANHREQQVRLWRLTQGLGSAPQDGTILHRTMRRPLRDEITAVRLEVARAGVDLVIADSLAPASGPEPEHADAALSALMALRSLAVTVLCIAHVSKVQADSKAPARPYGSVHINNLARSTFELRGMEGESADETLVSFFHRKSNNGPKQPPIAFRFRFEPDQSIRVTRGEPDVSGASLPYQVLTALRTGKASADELAEHLDANVRTIKSVLTRLDKQGKVTKLPSVSSGRGHKALWGVRLESDDGQLGN